MQYLLSHYDSCILHIHYIGLFMFSAYHYNDIEPPKFTTNFYNQQSQKEAYLLQ